jgi:cytosine/uracil/thiamine/allantoin permease
MSLDMKILLAGSVVWILMALFYVASDIMIEGARVWGAGAVIFFVLFLLIWSVERQSAQAPSS